MLMDNPNRILSYILGVTALFVIFSIPIDELAIDKAYLYHFKKSIIPFFTVVKRYEISRMKSINCLGSYSAGNDVLAFLSLGQLYQSANTVRIICKDDSVTTFNVGIYREDVDRIISTIKIGQ